MKKNIKLIDKLFLIILSVQTILMGILFIVQICRIYFNEKAYSRSICGDYLLQMLPVIIIWIIMIIASFIYFNLKNNKAKESVKPTNITKLNNLINISPEFQNESLNEEYELIKKEEKKRKIVWIINIVVLVISSIMGLCYVANVKHFNSAGDPTKQVYNMTMYLLPWCIITFASFIGCVIFEEYSAKKSIEYYKKVIKTDGKNKKEYIENEKKNLIINIVRAVLIVTSIVLIIVGTIDGGATDVLNKAVNICTECIGLG